MRWIGCVAGAFVGSRLGLGPIGSLAFSFLGAYLEHRIRDGRRFTRTGRTDGGFAHTREDPIADAYRTLNVSARATDEEVKQAYRAMAKACHPDLLRAKGASERDIARATERMARVNAAWSLIRTTRGL